MARTSKATRKFNALAKSSVCPYCGRTMCFQYGCSVSATWDHVVAKSKGGSDKILTCFKCNNSKLDLPLVEFLQGHFHYGREKVNEIITSVFNRLTCDKRLFNRDNRVVVLPSGVYPSKAHKHERGYQRL